MQYQVANWSKEYCRIEWFRRCVRGVTDAARTEREREFTGGR